MPEITVKDLYVLEALMDGLYHYKLVEIAKNVINLMHKMQISVTITSAFRNGDAGVHGYGRGLDFRSRNMSEDEINTIVKVINDKWVYDPKRPEMVVLMNHDIGKGMHLHLQTHPNTKERALL